MDGSGSSLGGHQSRPIRKDHRLDAVSQLELGENTGDVGFHSLRADEQLSHDLGIRQALADQEQHVEFARREDLQTFSFRGRRGGSRTQPIGEAADQGTGNRRGQE